MPTFVDLFSGCGGMSLGFSLANWTPLCAVDVYEDALKTYSQNFPETEVICADVNDQDLQNKLKTKYLNVDAVVGGPPCQGFSMASNRNRATNKERYEQLNSLPLKYAKLARSLCPKVIVMEEVPAAKVVVDEVETYLIQEGYNVTAQVYNASKYSVPQSRKRIILVATRSGADFVPPSPEAPISSGEALNRSPRPSHGTLVSEKTKSKILLFKETKQRLWGKFETIDLSKPSPTILTVTNSSTGPYALQRGNNFYNLSAEESARLQSFPSSYVFHGTTTSIRKQIGNAVPPMLARAIASSITLR